uniref:Ig-like domain-containing protein n=1 Tax=uncultured Rhizobium sp. TaxID=155567 RepID=UPI00262AE2D4|nr:Ig-like domain-containing protein [uncultured Rhizobium sp.]
MKNRALWLVLFVLAIATMLMVFVVMPRLNPTDPSAPTVTAATDAAKAIADQASATAETVAGDMATVASAKMDRLKAEAVKAVDGISALFADGRTPGVEAYSAAKTLAQAAITALAAIDIPDGLDEKIAGTLKTAQADAAKALAIIQQLPADPAKAASMIGSIKDALLGKPVETVAAPSDAGSAVPRFDVLRVEPDGSTVIAGNAAPGAKVEIVNGNTVISSLTVDGTGDFAAVLDNPLAAGDHSLQLRATDLNGKVVTSDEVATISVPEGGKGELLAMVSKPGEASRLITLPGQTAPSTKTATQGRLPVAPVAPDGTAAPAASTDPSISTPAVASTDVASADPGAASSPVTGAAEVQVSAVEIEGDKIFVAGKAPAGSTVRGFADKTLIGQITADASGNFIIEGEVKLSVGSHIIQVELLDTAGKVIVRASVPFERPEGEQVSVVAQTPGAIDAVAKAGPDLAEFERLRMALTKGLTILEGLYADGKMPVLEQVAAARSATEFGLQSIIDFRPTAAAPAELSEQVAMSATKAREALTALRGIKPGDIGGLGTALPKIVGMIRDLLAVPLPAPVMAMEAPVITTLATATESATSTSGEPKVIEQAPLAESKSSVIIRRGDTLWQISRRLYGQGVRYTTIYLANAEQIRNPDRIEPGQIFTVPSEALPNAEEIHRKRLHDKAIN